MDNVIDLLFTFEHYVLPDVRKTELKTRRELRKEAPQLVNSKRDFADISDNYVKRIYSEWLCMRDSVRVTQENIKLLHKYIELSFDDYFRSLSQRIIDISEKTNK